MAKASINIRRDIVEVCRRVKLGSSGLLTLVELSLAVLAVRARDYRSHMGWMALMFASLLTAPALRAQWLLFGCTGLRMDQANLIIAVFLVPETILVMGCWMLTVGAPDLGINPPRSILPTRALQFIALGAAIVAVHEALLAPFGFDLIHAWRGGHVLPASSVFWGLSTAVLAFRAPVDMGRLSDGGSVRATTQAFAFAAAIGGLVIAMTLHGGDLQTLAQRSFYMAWSTELALLTVFGRRKALGHGAPWDVQGLYLAFAPALWPFLAVSYVPLAVGGPVAITTAMAIAFATIAMLGFASAFGLRLAAARRTGAPVVGLAATA